MLDRHCCKFERGVWIRSWRNVGVCSKQATTSRHVRRATAVWGARSIRARRSRPFKAAQSLDATRSRPENRCQQGSGALGRSQVHSSSAKIAPKSSSGVPRNAFRAARDAPRAPRGGPTELPERPGAVQSESKRGSAAFRRAKVGFFGICVLVYTGA